MYFDTHAHYTDEAFDQDREKILSEVRASGVELIVNAGNNMESSLASIRLANEYPYIYAAVGWHPQDAKSFDFQIAPDLMRNWSREKKVVAIGEIGLDYYYDHPSREEQRAVFIRQMELAKELSLPVVIHDREAHADCLEIIKGFPEVKGEFHCFSGSVEMAREIVDMGWYIGFAGVVTFKNARKANEVAAICPPDRILIETDCPYLAPVPNRGKRNDSRNINHISDKISEIKGIKAEEAARLTLYNGKVFFGINE